MTHDEPRLVKVTLDVPLSLVREWDFIEIGGRMERVESVTVLHNGRRIHFLRGGRLTLSAGRLMRVTRTIRENGMAQSDVPFTKPSHVEGPCA
ncbi:hypothetical protein ACWGNE_11200 [Streptomyces xiamenensis]|uniref:hypothetical protein n=1 Tax=Streptomyces xiamenensis TaxID=408015 RepID=UPI00343D421C